LKITHHGELIGHRIVGQIGPQSCAEAHVEHTFSALEGSILAINTLDKP